jgi:hypothetical protein
MAGDDVMGLEAVAAAHAAAGARDRAARVMERAIAMANRAGDDSLTSALKARLEQYRRP